MFPAIRPQVNRQIIPPVNTRRIFLDRIFLAKPVITRRQVNKITGNMTTECLGIPPKGKIRNNDTAKIWPILNQQQAAKFLAIPAFSISLSSGVKGRSKKIAKPIPNGFGRMPPMKFEKLFMK
jgi:hypothetical protein